MRILKKQQKDANFFYSNNFDNNSFVCLRRSNLWTKQNLVLE
jgi:hypothetical protein